MARFKAKEMEPTICCVPQKFFGGAPEKQLLFTMDFTGDQIVNA